MGIYSQLEENIDMLFFRTDSNNIISDGHIMRCLAIAKEMVKCGIVVHFLIADDNPSHILEDAGISYTILYSDWKCLMSDVEQVKSMLVCEENPVLLVDTYRITREYVDALKPYCKIGYLGSKGEYLGKLDFLINYSIDINYKFYRDNYNESTRLLLGPSYAPLREEFQNVNRSYRNQITKILLTTGNTDHGHMIAGILEKLLPIMRENDIIVNVVVGRMFNDTDSLFGIYDSDMNVCFHKNVKIMSSLMSECDLAISANGTTVYELCAMGIPTISFAMVEEQVNSAEALVALGVIDYCGRSYENRSYCIENIVSRVKYYIDNIDELVNLAENAYRLIDGNGCKKIVDVILQI